MTAKTARVQATAAATAVAALLLAAGCPAPGPKGPAPLPPFHYHPGVKATDYFPLAAGASWTHAITRPGLGRPDEVLGITRVVEVVGDRASITSPGGNFNYVLAPDGIMKEVARTYVLKEPIVAGAKWETSDKDSFGVIDRVDATVTTRAGTFADCLVMRDLTEGQELETTYCPRVGPVLMELRARVADAPAPLVVLRGELVAFSTGGAAGAPAVGAGETTLEKIEGH
jgi:hypothetical protein